MRFPQHSGQIFYTLINPSTLHLIVVLSYLIHSVPVLQCLSRDSLKTIRSTVPGNGNVEKKDMSHGEKKIQSDLLLSCLLHKVERDIANHLTKWAIP